MIKYLGSKRTLVPELVRVMRAFPELTHVVDAFSGTSRVGHALKGTGFRVHANDHNAYAHTLARCYVEADRGDVERDAERLIRELSALPGRHGYFTETFCEKARFFQPQNGARVDAIRDAVADKGLPPLLESVVLTSLMEAADRVDSTCGVQMAYVKQWARRAQKPLELRMPDVLPRGAHGRCRATMLEAVDAVGSGPCDVLYLDPPYNQHSYLSNYHIWETLIRWDAPDAYGVAQKRVDCRSRKSDFNSKRRHQAAFEAVLQAADTKLLVVSFSDEGFQARAELEARLASLGEVQVLSRDYKRYVGAQIGIHNPRGERVGEVSHLRNKEFIYVVLTHAGRALGPLRERLGVPEVHAPT